MKFARRSFVAALFALGAAMALPVSAQVSGRDYTAIMPVQPTDDPAKIEVLEFFSYGCPHCNDFNPLLSAWVAKQQGDVVVKKVPVTFGRAAWTNIAKLFYTLEVTGDAVRLESDIFKAIHVERANLFDEKSMLDWVVKKGVDGKKFSDTYNSFGVNSKVKRAEQMAQAFKITGVPALAVEGRFLVGGKDFNDALAITDGLIAKVRNEKSGKGAKK
ncbi:MAG: thiol:disulfide interchange protein DsbA/DsbL [Rhodocyclales bacterium GT-UBC]|nr:MAG: thiol:disulfide interchange protein DsbA/DsbL [Rhodocyclales bacterium GT-UBC]